MALTEKTKKIPDVATLEELAVLGAKKIEMRVPGTFISYNDKDLSLLVVWKRQQDGSYKMYHKSNYKID